MTVGAQSQACLQTRLGIQQLPGLFFGIAAHGEVAAGSKSKEVKNAPNQKKKQSEFQRMEGITIKKPRTAVTAKEHRSRRAQGREVSQQGIGMGIPWSSLKETNDNVL